MRVHHTKTKGDLGVLQAQLDLVNKGYWILLPQTEHAPFDLVAYREGMFLRVQVKYRAAVNGSIAVPFRCSWADGNGVHTAPIDRSAVDVFCLFCPDTGRCYYVDPSATPLNNITLRITAPRNGQHNRVVWAANFTEIPASAIARAARVVESANVRQSNRPTV